MPTINIIQLVVFILIFFISAVFSIKCFQCNSYEHEECFNLKSNDTNSPFLKECEENLERRKMFCRKTIQTIYDTNNVIRVTRSCGWHIHKANISNCRPADTDFKFERSCQCFTDACNSGTNLLPISTLVTSFVIIVLNRFI